jgi:hypothetical protein
VTDAERDRLLERVHLEYVHDAIDVDTLECEVERILSEPWSPPPPVVKPMRRGSVLRPYDLVADIQMRAERLRAQQLEASVLGLVAQQNEGT